MRRKFPFCYDPFGLHTATLCEDVHHIIPIATDPTRAYDKRNLVTLCRACHAEVEQLERAYGETSFLFDMGVNKSLADKQRNTVCPAQKKIRHFGGGGGLKPCHDTNTLRKNAKGTIWCNRMRTFVSYFCGNCKSMRNKIKNV